MAKLPSPTLDNRNGDQVTAQVIGAFPSELSDRSDSNPAVVVAEAAGTFFDKLIYQINQWPLAVVQKLAALVGIDLLNATAATVTQQFTLSAPQPNDTTISTGATVSTADGSLVFATTSDLTIRAYLTSTGTISLTSGSTAVVGVGTAFTTDCPAGYQISTDRSTWYTVASVTDSTHLTLSSSASSTVSGSAFSSGPVSGSVAAQATTTGVATNAGANTLTTVVNAGSSVASTTNPAAATGGADAETVTAAASRMPTAFATREVACHVDDFAAFASDVLGSGSRVRARANFNVSTNQSGYVTVAMLSPNWTTATPVTTTERAAVMRDLTGRTGATATLVDLAVSIQSFTTSPTLFAVAVYRNKDYDEATVRANIAAAVNSYLNPSTYPWDPARYSTGYRPIYVPDLVQVVEAATGVDRVETINGVPAVGMNYRTSAASMTFTLGSASVTSVGATDYANATAGQTVLIDATNKAAYLVTAKSGGNAFTLDHNWAGSTGAASNVPFWTSTTTNLTDWFYLPYSSLSVSLTSPAASIVVVGSV